MKKRQSAQKFGRPSQGRTERLQVAVTPKLLEWIKGQVQGDESISQIVNRLLEGISETNESSKSIQQTQ